MSSRLGDGLWAAKFIFTGTPRGKGAKGTAETAAQSG